MLEACEEEELLGRRVSVLDSRVTFDVSQESWQYRLPLSTGSANAILHQGVDRGNAGVSKTGCASSNSALSPKYLEVGFYRHELHPALPRKPGDFVALCEQVKTEGLGGLCMQRQQVKHVHGNTCVQSNSFNTYSYCLPPRSWEGRAAGLCLCACVHNALIQRNCK